MLYWIRVKLGLGIVGQRGRFQVRILELSSVNSIKATGPIISIHNIHILTSLGFKKSSARSSVADGRLSLCCKQASMKHDAL